MDYNSIQKLQTGKGMLILHRYNDSLWEINKTITINGFNKDIVLPLNEMDSDEEYEEEEYEEEEENEEKNEEKNKEKNEEKNEVEEEKVKKEEENEIKEEEEEEEIKIEEMDNLLISCFIEVIKNQIKDNELPIDSSGIYSKMISSKQKNTHLDIKKSSYKKLTKFIKEMSKKKMIAIKEGSNAITVTKINREIEMVKTHKSELFVQEEKEEKKKEEGSRILELYKATSLLMPIFECLNNE
jgi:translation initiation factor 2D